MINDLLYGATAFLLTWWLFWILGCLVPGTSDKRFCGWNYSHFTDRDESHRWRD